MKLRASNNQEKALTLIDVVVIIFIVFILAIVAFLVLLPMAARDRIRSGPNCVNNLKEVYLGSLIWAGDHNDKFPFEISVANGGTREYAQEGDILGTFQVMSNELSTPKILLCQMDKSHTSATNFSSDFSVKNISYFVGLDADKNNPASIFAGDDNFEISGVPVKSDLLTVPANASIGWTAARHKFSGNIGLADGSVQQTTSSDLAGYFTNSLTRLAIP